MYLEEYDFISITDQDDLDVLTNQEPTKREKALKMALDEVRTYTRTKYRIDQEFAKTGDARNEYMMMIVMDLTLYHLCSMLPARMGIETRKERYDTAINWLKGVRDGKNDPGIPTIDNPNNISPTDNPELYDSIRFGGNEKVSSQW